MVYWCLKAVLSPVLLLLWRVRVEGRRYVPRRGPALLAANHQSFCDSFFLPLVIARRVTFVAKAEYFDSWKTGWFFRAAGQIPIRRDGGDVSRRALDTAAGVLADGKLLGIYPEGTRAPDEHLYRGRTGVARLAVDTGAPVVPVALVGTRKIQPPGRLVMRPFHAVTVRFGPPLYADPAAGDDPLALRAFTERLMAAIAELSGQERVDVYASEVRTLRGPAAVEREPDGER